MVAHLYHKNYGVVCKGLVGVLVFMICAHLIITTSFSTHPRSASPPTTSHPPNPGVDNEPYLMQMNEKSNQTWKQSSCTALHHKSIRWAYKNEREMLQAASYANNIASQILMLNQKNHDHADDSVTNNVGTNYIKEDNNHVNKSSDYSALPRARVAFLFLVRGAMPHEALWRRFFATSPDPNLYSVYVHASPTFRFPRGSFFHCKHIPSSDVGRFSFSVVDAMRRLLAHSLLDTSANNQRFVFLCEATIPIRNFLYTYNYLLRSNLSFVQAFKPPKEYYSWSSLPAFSLKYLRKGEMWMGLTRSHASLIVGDVAIYKKFKAKCKRSIRVCTPDEQYIQTLLSLRDPSGLANKTIMFVDWWSHADLDNGSPSSFSKSHISPKLIQKIQKVKQPLLKSNSVPTYHLCNLTHDPNNANLHCLDHSSVPYLFARKFTKDSAGALAKLSPEVLGY